MSLLGGGGGEGGGPPQILKTAKFVPKKRQYSTRVSSKRVGILPIWIPVVKFNVSSVGPSSERNMSLVYTLKTIDLELLSVTKAVVLFASVKPDKSHQFL